MTALKINIRSWCYFEIFIQSRLSQKFSGPASKGIKEYCYLLLSSFILLSPIFKELHRKERMDPFKNNHQKKSQHLGSRAADKNRRGYGNDKVSTDSILGKSSNGFVVPQSNMSSHHLPIFLPASPSIQDCIPSRSCHINEDEVRIPIGLSKRRCPHCKKQFSKAFSISKHVEVSPPINIQMILFPRQIKKIRNSILY